MKWLSFFRKSRPDSDFFERYKEMREIGRTLNVTLAKELPKPAVQECGKKLGLWKAGTLILNNDDEIGILYDYAIHHYRRGNKTVLERHIETSPPEPDSAEAALIQAMQESTFSIFRIEEVIPRQGANLRDLLTDEVFTLTDAGLSETGIPGALLAARIFCLPDFRMTSGTAIPIAEQTYEGKIRPIIRKFELEGGTDGSSKLAPAQLAAFVGQVIRVALFEGGEDASFYTDMEQ